MMRRLAFALFAFAAPAAMADEGMWTYDNPPLEQMKREYGFTPTQAWLDHLRLSSVRINDGGSGSFVSGNGLVMTNHHVAMGAIQKLSTPERNLVRDGFKAASLEQELKVPDMEMNVLVDMVNVTERVNGAVRPGASDEEAKKQREAEISRIEKESTEQTGLRSDVVELYQGGEHWLYRYKKYTDIRLVMAPEMQAAYFGGDYDNFTYPRYDLDMTFLRVYENGKPLQSEHFLKFSRSGAKDQEMVFVSGHPGRTSRLMTLAQLQYLRDKAIPEMFDGLRVQRTALLDYSARGEEQARQARGQLFGINNALKAYDGRYSGLTDAGVWAKKEKEERDFRAKVEADEKLRTEAGPAWDRIAEALKLSGGTIRERTYRGVSGSRLAGIASTLVRWVAEVEKPNEDRWEEFRESGLESLRHRLLSPAPMYKDLEKAMIRASLELSLAKLGADDGFVREALQGQTPTEAAEKAVAHSRLWNPDYRERLLKGGRKAVERSRDSMIQLARRVEGFYREQRERQDKASASVKQASAAIAKARFAVYGKSMYPDATFTLRLSYGKVQGYSQGTTLVPPKTTFFGLYDRAEGFEGQEPFDLTETVAKARSRVKLETPLNFVTTNDIIGGNSGSPVVNRDGEVVGLIFDGNIQSLPGDYVYEPELNRAVAVHSAGILEALTSIYSATELAGEIAPPAAPPLMAAPMAPFAPIGPVAMY